MLLENQESERKTTVKKSLVGKLGNNRFWRGMIGDSGLTGFIHRGNDSIPETQGTKAKPGYDYDKDALSYENPRIE